LRSYEDSLQQFIKFCLDAGISTQAEHVTREHVELYLADLLERGASAATASTRYRSLHVFFKWAEDEGEVRSNPMAKMSPPKSEPPPVPVIPDDDLSALIKACAGSNLDDRRDMALIRFFIDTGARLGEVAGLTLADIDLTTSTATVRGKGNRIRTVAFSQRATVALDRYLRARNRQRKFRNVDALWVGRRGRLSEPGIRCAVERRADLAGIGHIHPHQFRHTAAHRFLAAAGSETDLMSLSGWRSRTMLQRYAASTASQRAVEAYRRLGLGEDL
jgi:site-specific recombinase XerD